MTWKLRIHQIFAALIFVLLFLIPLSWSREVNANYFTTKMTLLYLTAGLCFLFLALRPLNFKWPRTTHFLGLIGLFFFVLQIVYSLAFNFPLSHFYLAKFFAFIAIFVFLLAIDFDLQKFLKKYDWLVLIFFAILLPLTIHNAVELYLQGIWSQNSKFMVPFGNANMMAEFYVLSVPFVFFWITQKFRIPKVAKWITFALVNLVLIHSQSRSVYIGLCLWWILYFYQHGQGKKKFFQMALMPFVFYSFTLFYGYQSSTPNEHKSGSNSDRKNFYLATADLIQENPLGIGLHYSNVIVPYRLNYPSGPKEFEYPDQPHSEILKWTASFGWGPGLLAIMALIWTAILIFRSSSHLLKGVVMVSAPQIIFQFPFENPASILWMAFYFYLIYRLWPSQPQTLPVWIRVLSVALGGFMIFQSYVYIRSIYNTSQFPNDYDRTQEACTMNPTYLPGCIMRDYNLLFAKRFTELRQNLRQDMEKNYYNVDLLKVTAAMLFESSKEKPTEEQNRLLRMTCEVMHVYKIIFKEQSHFSEADLKSCQVVPAPISNHRPEQFDKDYREWLDKILKDKHENL